MNIGVHFLDMKHETPLRLHGTLAGKFNAIRGIVPSQVNLRMGTTTKDEVKS